jgi:hypothetical protein
LIVSQENQAVESVYGAAEGLLALERYPAQGLLY